MATITAISTKGGGGGKKSLDYICRDTDLYAPLLSGSPIFRFEQLGQYHFEWSK